MISVGMVYFGEQYLLVGSLRDISSGVDGIRKHDFRCYGKLISFDRSYMSLFAHNLGKRISSGDIRMMLFIWHTMFSAYCA